MIHTQVPVSEGLALSSAVTIVTPGETDTRGGDFIFSDP